MIFRLFRTTILTIGCVFLTQISTAQGVGFDRALREQGDKAIPFCLDNTVENIAFLKAQKVRIIRTTKNWVFFNATPAFMDEHKRKGNIESFFFERPNTGQLMNDSSRVIHFVDQVQNGQGTLPRGYTGKGVIIGFVDNGMDYNHPDFLDSNGRTRVLRYWDHTLFNGPNSPAPYDYGQEWDSTDINNGTITSIDNQGHGSTVAGCAAGNGRANGTNLGMAPDANIIMIQTDFNLSNWTMTVAQACEYVFNIADEMGMPAVMNLSVGTYLGSHDGNDPASEYMEALLEEHPGRIIIGSAGNSGAWGKYHVEGQATADTTFTWLLNNPNGAINGNAIYADFWTDATNAGTIKFGYGADSPTYAERGKTEMTTLNDNFLAVKYDTIYSPSGNRIATTESYRQQVGPNFHLECVFRVDSTDYNFRIMTSGSGTYDIWSGSTIGANDFVVNVPDAATFPKIVDYQHPDAAKTIVSSWNCSEKMISVANIRNRSGHIDKNGNPYTPGTFTAVGDLSPNSSKGPNRHGIIKPDISAGGDVALSAGPLSFLANANNNAAIDSGGWHVRNGGTSMASPVVAGVAALYLERCPKGTAAAFKELLTSTAFSDNYTGAVPNNAFGYGKIHGLDLMQAVTFETAPTITQTDNLLIASTSPNYQWMQNMVELPGATNQTLMISPPNSNYSVYTVSEDGCLSVSDQISTNLGLEEVAQEGAILVPNPATEQIVVMANAPIDMVECYDQNGKKVDLPKIGTDTYSVKHLASGFYQVKVSSSDSVVHIKMLRID